MRLFQLVTRKQIQRYNYYGKRRRSKRFVLNHLKFVDLSYVGHNHNSVPCRYSKQLFSSVLCRTFNVKSIHLFAQKKNEHILVEWLLIADKGDFSGKNLSQMSNVANSTNIMWHDCPIQKQDRQQLLQQKGCVIWLTGLSGSGKSTIACALSRSLHSKGKLSYILDGDNIRHGLNQDLSFRAEDRSENIRRIGEVAKLFADAGVICITSLISPYQKDRDACRALMPKGDFIEVFIDVPLHVCEARDPKGLYKLARAGKIKGFTGIDDPYEPPSSCEIVLQQKGSNCKSPSDMAEEVISYLEENGYLRA
ncbi:hypothetical protein GLYMA_05G105300v4 [Glycine max]|uniref:Adenylyl-sulfate kinase n=2 Tax=Glycine subgen. Soja TaxID=1462606 RepID=K7KPG2_SOYBN|nr:adenylyl-sulfate kinase 3-like isoform X1 [Glycine soja]XP_040871724.1 adenylyl-sulfate kinase 3 isoform X1 [Glycine max]KAH1133753.1 hypothetical protein GYH30_012245 [Glycine max]KRH58095.1 hypothetical protein GLYMA_05G105300v4 [Glycine max]RZC11883.1 Adenylyl-sulfate kinase, chloroplastic isoform A [Glycine soja]|eukprot:XP_006579943.1 adenylyl-sulfate kinase 3 isoform X1 [Glycine max]